MGAKKEKPATVISDDNALRAEVQKFASSLGLGSSSAPSGDAAFSDFDPEKARQHILTPKGADGKKEVVEKEGGGGAMQSGAVRFPRRTRAGCELFIRYTTRTNVEFQDFQTAIIMWS